MDRGNSGSANKTTGAQALGTYLDSIGSSLGASNAVIVGLIVDVKDFADSTIGTGPENAEVAANAPYPSGRLPVIQTGQDEQRRLLDELRTQVNRLKVI